jgi:hypothetical protein
MQACCVKCRAKREMKDATVITMRNGKSAPGAACLGCGTNMFSISKR